MNCAIVLAAGRSTRMGAPKMLLPLAGRPVIARVVERLARTAVDRTFVVVGPDGRRVADALRGLAATVVENPDPEAGMLSSVRCGLRALPGSASAVLVALGDQPAISPAVVDAMLEALRAAAKGIVVPVHRGRRGHPLLFAARYRDEVLGRFDDAGLRGLLAAHPGDVLELDVADEAILDDMDTPEDYRRESARPGAAPPGGERG